MPRNGSGVYTLPQPAFVAGTVISSASVNSDFSDIAAALTGSLPRDGQAGMLGQFKATDGSSAVPSISFINDGTTGFSRNAGSQISVDINGVSIGQFQSGGWSGNLVGSTSVIIGANGAVPIGTCVDFAGPSAPQFWLMCQGQAVSRSTYANLFAVIGTQYGIGDGSTTFNVPDYRGKSAYAPDAGAGVLTSTWYGNNPNVLGAFGGSQNHTLTVNEAPAGLTGNNSSGFGITVSTGGGHIPLGTTALQDTGYGSGPIHGPATLSNAGTWTDGGTSISGSVGGGAFNIQILNAGNQPHTNVSPGIIMNKIIFAGV